MPRHPNPFAIVHGVSVMCTHASIWLGCPDANCDASRAPARLSGPPAVSAGGPASRALQRRPRTAGRRESLPVVLWIPQPATHGTLLFFWEQIKGLAFSISAAIWFHIFLGCCQPAEVQWLHPHIWATFKVSFSGTQKMWQALTSWSNAQANLCSVFSWCWLRDTWTWTDRTKGASP